MNVFETLNARRILASSEIYPHQFLFEWNGKPCFARGELVALTGKAKSGKTFVCSLLMALAVKQHLMGLRRIQEEPLKVLWIDTEQSADSTQEILCLRIARLIEQEIPEEQYFVYNFRQDNWQDRLSLVLACIGKHQPDLVIFDGIRDVVGDINNYQEAQTVLGKMLGIASFSNACIVCVLHQNKSLEDKTLRGALGTELQNKSFETYECQKDPDTRIFSMQQVATRKYDITQKLEWTVDDGGLPVLEEEGARNQEQGQKTTLDPQVIVQTIARGEDVMRASVFAKLVKNKFPEMRNNYRFNGFLFDAFS
ncbi:MAG: AAA family ATPase, partial [Paludibacteraceae bacterium]|nr:AAA family ATPase [Paludibacteraceae bacterium]